MEREEVWLPYGRTKICLKIPRQNLLGIYKMLQLWDSTVRQIRWQPFSTIQAAVDHAFEILGNDAKVIVLPEATSIVAKLSG